MYMSQLTQKFRRKGEIVQKDRPTERWRIIEFYDTNCLIQEVNGRHGGPIDYDELDRDWMPYRKPKAKPEEMAAIEIGKDNFDNELKNGDDVYYASGIHAGKGYCIKKGTVTGFTPCFVVVDGNLVSPDKIGKICT